jgi:hypothetical protein
MKHGSLVIFSKTMKIWKLPITSDWFGQLKVKNFYVEQINKQVKQMGDNSVFGWQWNLVFRIKYIFIFSPNIFSTYMNTTWIFKGMTWSYMLKYSKNACKG